MPSLHRFLRAFRLYTCEIPLTNGKINIIKSVTMQASLIGGVMFKYHKYRLKEIPRAHFEKMISNSVSDDLLRYLLLELDACYIPFFHGTDRHILQMTSQERDEAKKYCMSAVKFLMKKYDDNNWKVYSKTNRLTLSPEKYGYVTDAFIGASGWISENKQYEYDNVYITASPDKPSVMAAVHLYLVKSGILHII